MKTKKRTPGGRDDADIPTLTEVVTPAPARLDEHEMEAIQADLSTRILKLTEELTHNAAREIEAAILERVCDQLRAQLPELIDEALRSPLPRKIK